MSNPHLDPALFAAKSGVGPPSGSGILSRSRPSAPASAALDAEIRRVAIPADLMRRLHANFQVYGGDEPEQH